MAWAASALAVLLLLTVLLAVRLGFKLRGSAERSREWEHAYRNATVERDYWRDMHAITLRIALRATDAQSVRNGQGIARWSWDADGREVEP